HHTGCPPLGWHASVFAGMSGSLRHAREDAGMPPEEASPGFSSRGGRLMARLHCPGCGCFYEDRTTCPDCGYKLQGVGKVLIGLAIGLVIGAAVLALIILPQVLKTTS